MHIPTKDPQVIAEIGCNHKGDFDIALQMIDTVADFCKGTIVKFQKRHVRTLLAPDHYDAPHPVPHNAYGESYGAHREFLEFDLDQHRRLKEHAESRGLIYSTSVWDEVSAREITSLDPVFIKIPSACNLDFEMLGFLCDHYGGQIQLSLGMTTRSEEEAIVAFFADRNRQRDLLLYACTSGYPVPAEDTALLEIIRLRETYGESVGDIGFSGHHLGIAIDVAAYALGANWIERHFTLDRTWRGTDHAASLEPEGLRRLVRDLKVIRSAMQHKRSELLDIEMPTRQKLKRFVSD